MKTHGRVTNRAHEGLFVILCDSKARFGGWDEHGEMLADEGSVPLELDGLRAFVEEAHASGRFGHHEVLESEDGTIWLRTFERGSTPIPIEALEREARTEVVEMGFVDVPSGTLTIALAYPPLNTTSTGDHAGVVHNEGERVDVKTKSKLFAVIREFTESGQVVALRPR